MSPAVATHKLRPMATRRNLRGWEEAGNEQFNSWPRSMDQPQLKGREPSRVAWAGPIGRFHARERPTRGGEGRQLAAALGGALKLQLRCQPKVNLRGQSAQSPGQQPRSARLRVRRCLGASEQRRHGWWWSVFRAKRGGCDALAANQNKTMPLRDSSLGDPALPSMHHSQTASQHRARLTANLLDPLVAPHCSLSPPPRYCTQLQPPRLCTSKHKAGARQAPLFPPTHLPVRPSKEPRSSFLIPFELFSNGSKGIRERATRLRQTGF